MYINSYNKTTFNVPISRGRFVRGAILASETIEGVLGASKILRGLILASERMLSNEIEPALAISGQIKASEVIASRPVEVMSAIRGRISASERIDAQIHVGKFIHAPLIVGEKIDGLAHVGKIFSAVIGASEAVDSRVHIGKIIRSSIIAGERVHSLVTIALRRYSTFFIDTEMPPGSEIRIDSANFTVFLLHGGQTINQRGRFSGDWVHFDRDTQRICVENEGNQNIIGDVIYNDRWL